MFRYYTSIIIITWMSLGILCILIQENDRIPKNDKRLLYVTYALIAVSALAEWLGVYLDGRSGMPAWMLLAVKCADYILTPVTGGALVAQMQIRNKWSMVLFSMLIINTIFQFISLFTGWMIQIDHKNHYSHGPLYFIYIIICLSTVFLVIIQFIVYGRSFRRQNRKSLYAIMFLIVAGIWMQEGPGGGVRTAYIVLALGATLVFIQYEEFSSLAMDDYLEEQKKQIDTDTLTGLGSRQAYASTLNTYKIAGQLPPGLVAFTLDINGLKQVNDTLGHEAGDELICGAAYCIQKVLGPGGQSFRTGGDEFVVLANMNRSQVETALDQLKRETAAWRGKKVKELSLAVGYALTADYPELSAEKLVKESDLAMYTVKAEYYQNIHRDRRRQERH